MKKTYIQFARNENISLPFPKDKLNAFTPIINWVSTAFLFMMIFSVSKSKIQISHNNVETLWTYDKQNQRNEKTQQKLNWANGKWIFFVNLNRLEFHPHHSGMVIFSLITHNKFIYLEAPKRVLVFPYAGQMNSAFVDESAMGTTADNYVQVIFPMEENDLGDFQKLDECFTKMADTVFQEEPTKSEKLKEWNFFPYYYLKKQSDKVMSSYSNHAYLLHYLQEDMIHDLKEKDLFPNDIHSQIENSIHADFKKTLIVQFLITGLTGNSDYFFGNNSLSINQNSYLKKMATSAEFFANKIISDNKAFSQETQTNLNSVISDLVFLANELGMSFIFENRSGYFEQFFRFYNKEKSLKQILEEIHQSRLQSPIPRDVSDMHIAALLRKGITINRDMVDLGSFDDKFQTIKEGIQLVFENLYPFLKEKLVDLKESLLDDESHSILEKEDIDIKTNESNSTETDMEHILNNDSIIQSAFKSINFNLLIIWFLDQKYLGAVFTIYENLFFDNLNEMPVMEKLEMQTQNDAEMDIETFGWFRRLFVIMGMAEFKVNDDLNFVQYKSMMIFKEITTNKIII